MANVEQRAESEAAAKGLSGQARKSYIGGVFNRIRQAHDRATTPGAHGRKLFNRRERVQARLDARLAMQPHREAIDVLRRQRNERIAAHQDEPREASKSGAPRISGRSPKYMSVRQIFDELGALHKHGYAGEDDPVFKRIRALNQELNARRDKNPTPPMTDAERAARSAAARASGFAPAQPPKLPAPERQRQRAIADAIKHGAPDFPPGTLAAAQGKPAAKPATPPAQRELTPRQLSDYDKLLIERRLQEHRTPNGMRPSLNDSRVAKPAWFYRELYGEKQTRAALDRYPMERLREIAATSGVASSGSREQLLNRLEAAAMGRPAAKGKPAGARVNVRPSTYHGQSGYLISGHDTMGRNISIFSRSKAEAERMRDEIKAGREAKFDSEKGGGDGQRR